MSMGYLVHPSSVKSDGGANAPHSEPWSVRLVGSALLSMTGQGSRLRDQLSTLTARLPH